MITSKDVAIKAGVSVSTVSRVFSNHESISEKVRKKVLAVAEELHYIPDTRARNLKLNKRNTYGVIISDSNNPFYLKVITRFNALPDNRDMKMLIMFSEEDASLEYSNIISLLSSKVRAVLFTPTGESDAKIEPMLVANEVPGLQLYRHKFDGLDFLAIDDAYGAYLATKELIDNGHRDIALIDYDLAVPTHRDEGYIRAFKEANLPYKKRNIIRLRFNDNIDDTMMEVLRNKEHTAIIPVGAIMIHSLYRCLNNLNLRVKEDISIVGYDDVNMAEYLGLTVISHPFRDIAFVANEIIKNRINDPKMKPQHVCLKPFLISRDSVKKIK